MENMENLNAAAPIPNAGLHKRFANFLCCRIIEGAIVLP